MIRFDNHAFKGLDDSLKRLFDVLVSMGTNVSELVAMLPVAVERADADSFTQAKAIDKTINAAELEVDAMVSGIINKFTVISEDLRFILGAIKIAGTLERAADKIKNCTKRLSRINHPLDEPIKGQLLAAIAAVDGMIPLALAQLTDYEESAAQQLLAHGATVQSAYRTILIALHAHTTAADDETHILLVAKNLEQASDMAIEVMKICHFVHTGVKYEKNRAA